MNGTALSISEAELASSIENQLRSRPAPISEGSQGSIHLLELDGRRCIVKTPTGRGIRRRVRLATLRKEYRVYQRLGDMAGIPRCYGLVSGRHLVLEHLDGENLRHTQPIDRQLFFERLLATVQELHRKEVAHGDLKKKDNILVVDGNHPYVVDFGMAVIRRPGFRPLNRFFFRLFKTIDLNAWVKRKYGGYSADMSDEDRQYLNTTWLERFARRVGWPWHPLTGTLRRDRGPKRRREDRR